MVYGLVIVVMLSDSASVYSVSQKTIPLRLSDFFIYSETVRIFNRFFTHLLYIPMYARLQIFIQLLKLFVRVLHCIFFSLLT